MEKFKDNLKIDMTFSIFILFKLNFIFILYFSDESSVDNINFGHFFNFTIISYLSPCKK